MRRRTAAMRDPLAGPAAGGHADVYCHLPQLRDRIAPAHSSALRITPEVMALWDERARHQGHGADWRLSDAQLEATRQALLGPLDDGQDLWVFGYGSLMWDPGIHFTELRLAELPRHQRRFSHRTHLGRGSLECPGLMLSLEPGEGCCTGLAFRIDATVAEHESALLWRREMLRGIYRPQLLAVSTPQGEVRALVFAANPSHLDHVGELPLQDTAAIIARASGVLGSNRQYLEQLVHQLEHLGLCDDYLKQLLAHVRELG
jgi:cation transport protein ChaC